MIGDWGRPRKPRPTAGAGTTAPLNLRLVTTGSDSLPQRAETRLANDRHRPDSGTATGAAPAATVPPPTGGTVLSVDVDTR